jgi:hypothetical protein
MKRLTLFWLMVIGITISSFSQTSYPKKILFQNDTVVAITQAQLIQVNRSLNDYVHLKEAYALTQMDLAVSDSMLNYYKQSVVSQQGIISLQDEKFNKQTTFYEESLRREKKKSRKKSIGVGVGGTLLGIVLGVLLK